MKKLLLIAGCAALAACGQREEAAPADETNVAVAETEANVAAPAEFTLAETTWDYTQDGKARTTSIDGAGNYDTSSGSDIMSIFTDLWKQGSTLIIITHDPALARRAGRVVEVRDGKIVSDHA
jgi:hypothetical protein